MAQFASIMERQEEVSFKHCNLPRKMVGLHKELRNFLFNCQSLRCDSDLEETVAESSSPVLLMLLFAIGMFRPVNACQQSTKGVINKCLRVIIDKMVKSLQQEGKTSVLGSMMIPDHLYPEAVE